MYKLYPDTEKKLSYDIDYKPIMDRINYFKMYEIPDIIDNLEKAMENAFMCHSDMLYNALHRDICELKKWYIVRFVSCLSSGTIAGFIKSSKYRNIDNAVNKTLVFLFHADYASLFSLRIDEEGIKNLVYNCYHDNTL